VIVKSLGIEQANHQVVDNGHRSSHAPISHAGVIFLKSNVSAVMQAIYDPHSLRTIASSRLGFGGQTG
jgi:hypothetical protein